MRSMKSTTEFVIWLPVGSSTNTCGLASWSNCSGLPLKKTPHAVHRVGNPRWSMQPTRVRVMAKCERSKRPRQVDCMNSEPEISGAC